MSNWAIFALGLWLAVSPCLAGYASYPAATANAALTGVAALAACALELDRRLSRLIGVSHIIRR